MGTRMTLVVTLAVLAVAVSAQRSAAGVGTASSDAVAHHGAWQMYRRLALYFGRQALRAEANYWQAVKR